MNGTVRFFCWVSASLLFASSASAGGQACTIEGEMMVEGQSIKGKACMQVSDKQALSLVFSWPSTTGWEVGKLSRSGCASRNTQGFEQA